MRKAYTFTIEIEVHDFEALAAEARKRAENEGLDADDWAAMREDDGDPTGQDLIMLLDPGLIGGAGFEILYSGCENHGGDE